MSTQVFPGMPGSAPVGAGYHDGPSPQPFTPPATVGMTYPAESAHAKAVYDNNRKCARCGKPPDMMTTAGRVKLTAEQGGCICPPRINDDPVPVMANRPPAERLARATEQNTAVLAVIFRLLKAWVEQSGADVSDIELPRLNTVAAAPPTGASELSGVKIVDALRAKDEIARSMAGA